MSITHLRNVHLQGAELEKLKDALTVLEGALSSLDANLTPAERQKYGAINEQNKLFVNKVRDFHQNQKDLSVPDIDWEEFEKDYQSRQVLERAITRVDALRTRLVNAKILHDFDNYQAALEDYAYTSYRAGSQAVGYETKRNELKQFFNRTKKADITKPSTDL